MFWYREDKKQQTLKSVQGAHLVFPKLLW